MFRYLLIIFSFSMNLDDGVRMSTFGPYWFGVYLGPPLGSTYYVHQHIGFCDNYCVPVAWIYFVYNSGTDILP
jgi:hypothetical protein